MASAHGDRGMSSSSQDHPGRSADRGARGHWASSGNAPKHSRGGEAGSPSHRKEAAGCWRVEAGEGVRRREDDGRVNTKEV